MLLILVTGTSWEANVSLITPLIGYARIRHLLPTREALVKLTTLPLLAGENVSHRDRPNPSGPVRKSRVNEVLGRGWMLLRHSPSGPVRGRP
jgi:hypothetical protein